MEFKQFNTLLREHIQKMTKNCEYLFVVNLEKGIVWDTYLDSFLEGTNEVFRERREHDCSACRHFIRDFGRVVTIKDGEVTTIWDFDAKSDKYQPVVDALSALVRSASIANVFIPTERSIGVEKNRECLDDGNVHTWYHLYTPVPGSLRAFRRDEIGTVQGRMRDVRNVLQRSLSEIDKDAVDTVLELIAQKSLYKGEEWSGALTTFKRLQQEYMKLRSKEKKELYCWEMSLKVGPAVAKIKNHSIGVLLMDLTTGGELDDAVRIYESIVAPLNYQRSKPVFTKRMIQQAQKKVEELGYKESLARRYAQLEDITVNNTLFANRGAAKAMEGDVFEQLAADVSERPKNLSKVEEIGVETFVKDVLPTATDVEVLLENGHAGNMVSLVAPKDADAKSILKWNGNFTWSYAGDITDSMKEHVKKAGGKVDGVLRFSIQWNDNDDNKDDLDAHCHEPGGYHIFYSCKNNRSTGGNLDVDIIHPKGVAVENITWPTKSRMRNGTYRFLVHCFSSSMQARSGFSAEIEFDGQIHRFSYDKPLRRREFVAVADVTFDGKEFALVDKLASSSQMSSREVWGLRTNHFHPVTIAMHSPNYWDGQKGIGHRHVFFFLDKCRNPDPPRGFFVEFLDERLREHRKVFEALGAKFKVEDSDNQLSGLGFSMTKRATMVVKVKGAFERMLKVKF